MTEVRKTWEWGNLDGRDWARRTDAELVKAVCHFMTHDDADYEDLCEVLATDDEFALLNPDPIYQEGWFHGVCQQSIPRYVVHSRFEEKECLRKCVICAEAVQRRAQRQDVLGKMRGREPAAVRQRLSAKEAEQ